MGQVKPVRILWVYPDITEADRALIRAAKEQMDVEYLILPKVAQIGSCGVSGRVLALRETPPWITNYAPVVNPENQQGLMAAIHWACTKIEDARAVSAERMLSEIMGKAVTEVSMDQLAYENASTRMKLHYSDRVPVFQ